MADLVPLLPSPSLFFPPSSLPLPSLLPSLRPWSMPCMQLPIIKLDYNRSMTPEQRSSALLNFVSYLDSNPSRSSTRISDSLSDLQIDQSSLPQLQSLDQLLNYHEDITSTITRTFRQVSDIMVHMRELKNRKKNVQRIIDCATACVEVKRLSYGLGSEPREVLGNLQSYYGVKEKAKFVDRFVERVQGHIAEVEKEYQATFDAQMTKNNSSSIAELSKVLQLIRKHSHKQASPDSLQQIIDFCVSSATKEFKKIEEELFAVPLVGSGDSNYQFFDMAKTAMKAIVSLSSSCRVNVVKVSGEEGLMVVLRRLFEVTAGGVILELLMRLRKYYEVDKIALQNKFTIKEKDLKKLQPYFKEFVAIWNQLERLRLHLLAEVNDTCQKKQELKVQLECTISSSSFMEISSNAIQLMQAIMRFRFNKGLQNSPFVVGVCSADADFLKESPKGLAHCPQAQDFLEETMGKARDGIETALQTLNTLIISAIINFANHSLIYDDVFYSFNEMFSRSFSKLPSNDTRALNAVVLVLNALHALPRALRTLLHIGLPEEIPAERLRAELQEVVSNNQEKAGKVLEGLMRRVVSAQWFRYELGKDHEKIVEKWIGLQGDCFGQFVQLASKVHAELLKQTEFSKKYTQISAFAFEKEVRGIISYYEKHSHSILPNFTPVLDYIQILLLQDEDDFARLSSRFSSAYPESELRRIWSLRA